MGLGLAHLRLTSQMRCSHFTQSVKFYAKDITLWLLRCADVVALPPHGLYGLGGVAALGRAELQVTGATEEGESPDLQQGGGQRYVT